MMHTTSIPHSPDPLAASIQGAVASFMLGEDNDLSIAGIPEPAFGTPLLGVSSGADTIWDAYKTHVGPFHWTPLEAFMRAFPDKPVSAGELSVICWILPQTQATRKDQRKEKTVPAERWIRARVAGEKNTNSGLRKHLVAFLAAMGIPAMAPVLHEDWAQVQSERFGFASTWSERHAAYAAGLGTFGLCDGLITPVGKSVRVGSVIARLPLPVTPRPYSTHREYCLFFNSDGFCEECIRRCPAGAISRHGHDKLLCHDYAYGVADEHAIKTLGYRGLSCGLCQVGVPCESGIPKKPR